MYFVSNFFCFVPGATEGIRGEEDVGDASQAKTGDRGGRSQGKEDHHPRRERIVSIVLHF